MGLMLGMESRFRIPPRPITPRHHTTPPCRHPSTPPSIPPPLTTLPYPTKLTPPPAPPQVTDLAQLAMKEVAKRGLIDICQMEQALVNQGEQY